MDTSRFRAILLLALVFATGAAVGVAADRLDLFADATVADPPAEATPSETRERDGGPRGRQTTIEQFADELGLTTEQRLEIEGFLDHYRDEVRSLRRGYQALLDSVLVEVESVLTDEQVEDYREFRRQRYGSGRDRERGRGERDDSQGND